jgi:hypothetical protein
MLYLTKILALEAGLAARKFPILELRVPEELMLLDLAKMVKSDRFGTEKALDCQRMIRMKTDLPREPKLSPKQVQVRQGDWLVHFTSATHLDIKGIDHVLVQAGLLCTE